MKKQYFIISLLAIGIFTSCKKDLQSNEPIVDEATATQQANNGLRGVSEDDVVPNEILVKFKKGTSETGRANALARISGSVKEHVLTKVMERFGDEGVYLVHTPIQALEAISKAKGLEVEYAEPNFIYHHDAVSNDTYYTNGSLWGMSGDGTSPANQYGIQAGEAWTAGKTGSSSVFVGIIDEGAMYNHEDLAANFGNPKEIAGNKKDDDGNGYVDDVNGWDFVNNESTTFDGTDDDHGTHVAGTIGAIGGNGKGVAGVNWSVKMISAKFLGTNGGTTANAIKAVDYITGLKNSGLNIVASNNSWGGGGFSQALKDAIDRAQAADILFIAAAGNDGLNNDATLSYPSGYASDNIIAVASITSTGGLSSFSNYGASTVDIGAPGSGIYSTLPVRSKGKVASGYGSYSGTSMATPHVTGGVALYKSTHSAATYSQIKSAILSAAVPTSSLTGKCVTGGRLNVSGF